MNRSPQPNKSSDVDPETLKDKVSNLNGYFFTDYDYSLLDSYSKFIGKNINTKATSVLMSYNVANANQKDISSRITNFALKKLYSMINKAGDDDKLIVTAENLCKVAYNETEAPELLDVLKKLESVVTSLKIDQDTTFAESKPANNE